MDFANTMQDYERFEQKWSTAMPSLAWRGGLQNFEKTQHTIREIWEGKRRGHEHQLVGLGLGLHEDYPEYAGSSFAPAKRGLVIWESLAHPTRHQ